MLKISLVAKHTVVQMAGCAKNPTMSNCPDIMTKWGA